MLPAAFEQATVGRIGHGFFHHRGVDDDLLETLGFDPLAPPGGRDGFGQQPLDPFFSDALAPACHRRGIDRRFMLEVGFATEVLPIRVLDPGPEQILIRAGEGMLQVEQPRDQARRTGRTSGLRGKESRPTCFEDGPVDQLG